MCQEAVSRLCNPSESCHVRKVTRLLVQAPSPTSENSPSTHFGEYEYSCGELVALNEQVMEMTTHFVLPRTESLPPGINWVRQREQRRRPCLQTARPSDSGMTSGRGHPLETTLGYTPNAWKGSRRGWRSYATLGRRDVSGTRASAGALRTCRSDRAWSG